MSDKPDDKGLLNELLPDPNQAAEDLSQGSPRARTTEHLRRILAAGFALQLAGETAGCGSPSAQPTPAPPSTTMVQSEPTGYAVVDPIPPPPPSPVPLPSPDATVPAMPAAIRTLVADYGRAIQEKNLPLFKTLRPSLTANEERRVRDAFQSREVRTVRIVILSCQISGAQATVWLSRQDTIDGWSQAFQQILYLAKAPGGWTIREIGR